MSTPANIPDPQGDASRLLAQYAERLLVVQYRDHHDLLSLDDNGATWSDNPTRLREWHREVAVGQAAAIAVSEAVAGEIRVATGFLRRARTRRGFERMVGAVGQAFLHMQDSGDLPPLLSVCQAENLDRDPRYLGCTNGVVDLNAGRLVPPEEGRHQLISRNTGVAFDPEAKDGFVDDLLACLSEPERCYLLAALGHALRGGAPKRWYLLCGAPGSQERDLLRTIAETLGTVQSGGYSFFLTGRTLASGRHTVTKRFAGHLRDFTRGRIALGDGLPARDANLNTGLIQALTRGGHLPEWEKNSTDEFPPLMTATIFEAILPEDIERLDLSDLALVDRTHVLSYQPRDSRTSGGEQAAASVTEQARRAMLALLVQHAVENPRPPDAPESVTGLLRARRRASIGSVGRWLLDHLQVTGDGDETVLVDEIMAALAEDIPPDDQARFEGRSRREVLALARDLIDGFPPARRVKRGNQLLTAYPGLRLLKTAVIQPAGAALPVDAYSEMDRLIVDVALGEHVPAPCVCICCGGDTDDQALKKCWYCATALVMGRQADYGSDTLAIWGEPVYWAKAMWAKAANEFQRMLDAGEVPPAEALPYQPGGWIWSDAKQAADAAALEAYLAQPEWSSAVIVHPVTLPALARWIAAGHCPLQALAQSRRGLDDLCRDGVGHPRWAWCPGDEPVTLQVAPVDGALLSVPDLLSLVAQHTTLFPDAQNPDPLGPLVRAYLEALGSPT